MTGCNTYTYPPATTIYSMPRITINQPQQYTWQPITGVITTNGTGGNYSVEPNFSKIDYKKILNIKNLNQIFKPGELYRPSIIALQEDKNYNVELLEINSDNKHLKTIVLRKKSDILVCLGTSRHLNGQLSNIVMPSPKVNSCEQKILDRLFETKFLYKEKTVMFTWYENAELLRDYYNLLPNFYNSWKQLERVVL